MLAPPALTTTMASVLQSSPRHRPLQTKTVYPPPSFPRRPGGGMASLLLILSITSCGLAPRPLLGLCELSLQQARAQASVSCRDARWPRMFVSSTLTGLWDPDPPPGTTGASHPAPGPLVFLKKLVSNIFPWKLGNSPHRSCGAWAPGSQMALCS